MLFTFITVKSAHKKNACEAKRLNQDTEREKKKKKAELWSRIFRPPIDSERSEQYLSNECKEKQKEGTHRGCSVPSAACGLLSDRRSHSWLKEWQTCCTCPYICISPPPPPPPPVLSFFWLSDKKIPRFRKKLIEWNESLIKGCPFFQVFTVCPAASRFVQNTIKVIFSILLTTFYLGATSPRKVDRSGWCFGSRLAWKHFLKNAVRLHRPKGAGWFF